MPTETVYGLAADALNGDAVKKVFAAKGRPCDNPLIVHICELPQLDCLATAFPDTAKRAAKRFWPGPLTMILPKSEKVPYVTSGGLDTVGIRMPENIIARKLIKACGTPLAAPSANLSGKPSPTCAGHVFDDLNGRIPAILDGGECTVGVESTVICFDDNETVRILRPGAVTREQLLEISESVVLDKGILNEVDKDAVVSSPGMKYKHYSPKANVILVQGSLERFAEYAARHKSGNTYLLCFDGDKVENANVVYYGKSVGDQARLLFSRLRELDKLGADTVFARVPSLDGIGLAVYNRILRAAAFDIVEVGD